MSKPKIKLSPCQISTLVLKKIMNDSKVLQVNLPDIQSAIDWRRLIRQNLKILFVTDYLDTFEETESVYQYMNDKVLGCTVLKIDRALYREVGNFSIIQNPDEDELTYINFRFQSTLPEGGLVIENYDVIFIFAFHSLGSISDVELETLHTWMNNGGGVFATGDHSTLGEYMCTKIPRVGTMRKWSQDDEVPPGTGLSRIDTNQPDPNNPGEPIPNSAQRDEYPQNIKFIPYRTEIHYPSRIDYPHEILCHPTLGVIDVMPDHPHEGECVTVSEIDLTAKVDFGARTLDEYPLNNGDREKPRIIATGRTSSEYGALLAKGPVNAKEFNMISVYDGHKANVGRVVVDSTWHHWYGMNIDGLIAAGGDNWEKIGRYFLNVAKYLAPPGVFRQNCWFDIIDTQFDYPFNEEQLLTEVSENIFETGTVLHEGLRLRWGECGVLSFVIDSICEFNPALCQLLEEEIIRPFDPELPPNIPGPICLSCPPFESISAAVLGGVVRGTAPMRKLLYSIFYEGNSQKGIIKAEDIEQLAKEGMKQALYEFSEMFNSDLQRSSKKWSSLRQ